MENNSNITQKLLKIVKNRKTSVLINKQENAYKKNRTTSKSLAYESYSFDSSD